MCRLLLIIDTNYNKDIIFNFLKQSIFKKNTPNINSIKILITTKMDLD